MRILSGIQPSGILHIGNYFGMMRPAIALQAEGEALYFIADYHALTSVRDPAVLRENSRRVALDFLACGLDPEQASLFPPVRRAEVTELAWILDTVTPMGLLERAHSYKDKVARGRRRFSRALHLSGADGGRHLDLRQRRRAGRARPEAASSRSPATSRPRSTRPTAKLSSCRSRAFRQRRQTVPGLDGQKMSKSYGNTIDIFAEEKEMRKRVMSIVTDSTPVEAPKNPDASTIFQLFSLVASPEEVRRRCAARSRKVEPATVTSRSSFSADCGSSLPQCDNVGRRFSRSRIIIDGVLAQGAERANTIANEVMTRVRNAVGLALGGLARSWG